MESDRQTSGLLPGRQRRKMKASPDELRLADLKHKYAAEPIPLAYARLYDDDPELGRMFGILHQRLNTHFAAINDRALTTRHHWAESSRQLLDLIRDVHDELSELRRAGVEVTVYTRYENALSVCEPWLSRSGGSTIPPDFVAIDVVRYEPVFTRVTDSIRLTKQPASNLKLTMVGEGSYAHVHSYVDPDYGIKFAVKRAKRNLAQRDLERFKREFEVMKRLSFPYIVEVYRYDDDRNEYRMEFCDETLHRFVLRRNAELRFGSRKRIALQFLYGLNYIHLQGLLHRDISLQNVLLKVFAGGAVLVKLSDFGLVKDQESDYTHTGSEVRGTIRDPLLESFKDYSVANEIYATGSVLAFIFTGKKSLAVDSGDVGRIVQRCVDHDASKRYRSVAAIIPDVEALIATPSGAPA